MDDAALSMSDREILTNFPSGCFNQDWPYDGPTWEAVVANYVAQCGTQHASRDLQALRRFTDRPMDDVEIERVIFGEFGCYYKPSGTGQSARVWLGLLVERISGAIREHGQAKGNMS